MNQILLLTKNFYLDIKWQTKLQQLGYEVFCSTHILDNLLIKKDFKILSFFKFVLFSESVANDEVLKILALSKNCKNVFVRIENENSYKESLKEETELKFIGSSMSLTEIRETLMSNLSSESSEEDFETKSQFNEVVSEDTLGLLFSSMSKKEKMLFEILYTNNSQFVTRSELSKKLWDKEPSNSNLAQLSQLISRIKKKMARFGIDTNLLLTNWNQGYAFDNQLSESISAYIVNKNLQNLAVV